MSKKHKQQAPKPKCAACRTTNFEFAEVVGSSFNRPHFVCNTCGNMWSSGTLGDTYFEFLAKRDSKAAKYHVDLLPYIDPNDRIKLRNLIEKLSGVTRASSTRVPEEKPLPSSVNEPRKGKETLTEFWAYEERGPFRYNQESVKSLEVRR